MEKTKYNSGLIVNFAFNYGGRDDILQAVQRVIGEIQCNKIDLCNVDEELFRNYLYTKQLPDPELVIRTGGEKRMSNFLLWQASLAELYFTDVYFPDFNKEYLEEALQEYWERSVKYQEQMV